MSRKDKLQPQTVANGRQGYQAQDRLALLQSHLAMGGQTTDPSIVEETMGDLSTAIEQLGAEHAGMAEELLAVYEQLGIVFEVTRALPGIREESDVLRLFLQSLSRSFHQCRVSMVQPKEGDWSVHGNPIAINPWSLGLIRQAQSNRKVFVESIRHPSPEEAPRGVVEVMVAPVFSGEQFVCALFLCRQDFAPEFRASDMLVMESLATFCGDLIRNDRLLGELRELSISMVRSLVNAVDQKDPYTSGHSVRVAYFATLLAKELNLPENELQMLQWSALLHDVGKIGIRDAVLQKEGKLTEDEFDHMKEHPLRSHRMVKEVPQLAEALDGVLYHHERYKGGGYPSGLTGEAIPLQARIIQIADVFDALTSTRSYRPAFDYCKALTIMEEEAGSTFDPSLQQVFDRLIRRTLDGDPQAWERMMEQANRFTQEWNAPSGEEGGS